MYFYFSSNGKVYDYIINYNAVNYDLVLYTRASYYNIYSTISIGKLFSIANIKSVIPSSSTFDNSCGTNGVIYPVNGSILSSI